MDQPPDVQAKPEIAPEPLAAAPADVASAARSCTVILLVFAVLVLLACVAVGVRLFF